ncbi:MAG: formate--tetrahydrofolate ligase [Armatimonadetes bacterium]|nr:formate--tetrahydrofolate ligase [Armatimonadota bacterium]
MTNLEIAQKAHLAPIGEIATKAGLGQADFESLGRYKAKLTWEGIHRLQGLTKGKKLVLVTAMTPTPTGEGKTTITVGLSQALNKLGKKAIPSLREPALGPVMGNKGGACGGGYSQVLPMEDINLFFTGDFPAISAANNLLAALLDAHVQHGNPLAIDIRQPIWPRVEDLPDRALREIVVGLGGTANGYPRETGYVITPASEVMAIFGLSRTIPELKKRLGRIVAGMTRAKVPINAAQLQANGAMTALLRDALRPNLVQTLEGTPAFVHGGPFANIAHGCSSVLSIECALGMGDYCITEAGFASDLGGEKFMHILSPVLGRGPDLAVLVVTVKAIRHHGKGQIAPGFENVRRHIQHLAQYGIPTVVAINHFVDDAESELTEIMELCNLEGVPAEIAKAFAEGGEGCMELAETVDNLSRGKNTWRPLVSPSDSVEEKLDTIVRKVYQGNGVRLSDSAKSTVDWLHKNGLDHLPVCVAKTQYSFCDNPALGSTPSDFEIFIREIKPSVGAGFVVAISGDIMQMPGLGKTPGAHNIDVNQKGEIIGLF